MYRSTSGYRILSNESPIGSKRPNIRGKLSQAWKHAQARHAIWAVSSDWMNLATLMIAAIRPLIGTTAFRLPCSQRITRQWELAASTDYLTGLPNRRTLAAAGEARIQSAGARRNQLAVAVIDIDHFKSINDRFGHDVGDVALMHVAARVEAACRGSAICGRQGGEQFVALFERVDMADQRAALSRYRWLGDRHATPESQRAVTPCGASPTAALAGHLDGQSAVGASPWRAWFRRTERAPGRVLGVGRSHRTQDPSRQTRSCHWTAASGARPDRLHRGSMAAPSACSRLRVLQGDRISGIADREGQKRRPVLASRPRRRA